MTALFHKEDKRLHSGEPFACPNAQGLIKAIAAMAALDHGVYESLQQLNQNALKPGRE